MTIVNVRWTSAPQGPWMAEIVEHGAVTWEFGETREAAIKELLFVQRTRLGVTLTGNLTKALREPDYRATSGVRYAVWRDDGGVAGGLHGPFPTAKEALAFHGEDKHDYVVRLRPNASPEKLYRWRAADGWRKLKGAGA